MGAVSGEAMAQIVHKELYGNRGTDTLNQSEKETLRAIATLASGLVGAAQGGSFETAATAAAAGYNAAVNNQMGNAAYLFGIQSANNLNTELQKQSSDEKQLQAAKNAYQQYLDDQSNIGILGALLPNTMLFYAKTPEARQKLAIHGEVRNNITAPAVTIGVATGVVSGAAMLAAPALAGEGAAIAPQAFTLGNAAKAAGVGGGAGGATNLAIQATRCSVNGGGSMMQCAKNADYGSVGISAITGAATNTAFFGIASSAGVGQVTNMNILRNAGAPTKFIQNNSTGTTIWLNQTATGASTGAAAQGVYNYYKNNNINQKKD